MKKYFFPQNARKMDEKRLVLSYRNQDIKSFY